MKWRVEVGYKPGVFDAVGHLTALDIHDLGIEGVTVKSGQIYWLEGDLNREQVRTIAEHLLADPVTEDYEIYEGDVPPKLIPGTWVVEVRLKPGVTDAVGDSVVKGVRDMGITGISSAKTGTRFIIEKQLTRDEIDYISRRLLHNDVIQTYEAYSV